MSRKRKPRSIIIIGRRWFQKTYGNTYHSAQVMIDGITVWKSDKCYGYGIQFEQTGADWLEKNGYMPDRKHYASGGAEPAWQYFRDDRGIAFTTEVIDVAREKDL